MTYTFRIRLRGALLACVGLLLALASDARCDPVQEEIDATRQSIIRGIRDDIQRRTRRTKEIAPNNANHPKSRRGHSSSSNKEHE
jgi:hypothetical protein